MEYEIVEMKACHVCQVAALEQSCFSDPWSAGSVASELDNPLSLWLVPRRETRFWDMWAASRCWESRI